ncbi:hypothetical protein OG978_16690 [Streptomyces sp. NBC_01591]|uniref:hypothetical protein n=1 Tax=Streptomyces sp. NBC_01591 TaxID=2975888 RepID=UPI002DDBA23D|nr:hypothetical protein [Streptomyces sp. NBC_01591]WSD68892.1 hypothetical protein OG978_16690 [Streptomyces sp. NBC_01591]
MRLLARASAATLSAATALALATACGMLPDDAPDAGAPYARLTAPEVVNKALAATRAAKSVRMTVETTSPEGPVEAYVATDIRGTCTVTLSMGAAGTMELVRTGGTVRTRSDAAMLRAAAATDTNGLTGRWVKPATGDGHAELAERYCDRETFLGLLAPKSGTAHKGRATAPGAGAPALTVTGETDDGKWTADIATDGKPFLLRLKLNPKPNAKPRLPHDGAGHDTDHTAPVTVEFSEFDKPFTAKEPKT